MPRPPQLPTFAAVDSIGLTPGQTLRIWLPAGATLVSNGPSLSIVSPPQWIAGQMVQQRQVVVEGQSLWLEQGGWMQIDATRGGELLTLLPLANPGLARLTRVARHLAGRISDIWRDKELSGVSKTG